MSTSAPAAHVNGFSDANGHLEQPTDEPTIINIQQSTKAMNLEKDIVNGLRSQPKYLPSVLLWTAEGLKLFDEITRRPEYYPIYTEIEILKTHVDDIVKNVVSDSVLIELGSGNLKKTIIILEALARQQKSVQYYALDLSESELRHSLSDLAKLMGHSPYIHCQGLLGSYDDVTVWLQKTPDVASKPKTYLWMGNSIANHPPREVVSLLVTLGDIPGRKEGSTTSTTSTTKPSFIIAVDNCRDPHTINRAYTVEPGACDRFISGSMKHVNALAGREVFREDEWALDGVYEETDRCYRSYYVARKETTVRFSGEEFRIARGEYVRAMHTWKWDVEQIKDICGDAGLKCASSWQHKEVDYGMYLLEPGSGLPSLKES